MYDGLLRLKLPRAVTPVADDIAIVIVAKHPDELVHLFEIIFERYQKWIEEMGQKLTAHKTECTLITSRKAIETATLRVREHEIMPQPSIRYLGVMADTCLNFKAQVEHASAKAATIGRSLLRLMPNVGGLKRKRRALLTSVTTSVMTYGIAIWAVALVIQDSYWNVASVHRISALRTAGAFRTVFQEAAYVIAVLMPIQVLSDHGCFRAYLYKFKHEESPECPTCVGILKNAKHVFFTCPRFREQRQNLETAVDLKITPDNVTEAMLSSEDDGWKATTTFATKVLQDLRQEEQRGRK